MDESKLEFIGFEVYKLLKEEKYAQIASKFGYALAFDTEPAIAIKNDFRRAVQQCNGQMDSSSAKVSVSKFATNDTGLLSLVSCEISFAAAHGTVVVDLILNSHHNVYVEDISYVAEPGNDGGC